ncbi:MAG TPA: triose-phosphate isomerase [Gammaproteobacteria bacterium]|nr:triose-phosphate isomerase [Gammaproteobacteria bacterium]
MRSKVVVANWKMHGSKESAIQLVGDLKQQTATLQNVEVAVCVPYVYLESVHQLLVGDAIKLGAQNVNEHEQGAYTGEISAKMLLDFNTQYVLVGHSERRTLFHESDQQIAEKFVAAQAAGLIPILCVGEHLEQRQKGETEQLVESQLATVIEKCGGEWKQAVIAYEPIWAIGTGQTASPEQAQEIHQFIRQRLVAMVGTRAASTPILYGGSVKAENAAQLFEMDDIDGGLVGGASLDAGEFSKICHAAR